MSKDQISTSRKLLQNPYAYLDGDGSFDAIFGVSKSRKPCINIDGIRDPRLVGQRIQFEKVEQVVRSLHLALWAKRHDLGAGDDPFAMLEPERAFTAIGYDFQIPAALGRFRSSAGMTECAGFIDKSRSYAGVSGQLPLPVRNFTAAHELGHALLHGASGMHRDRALDGGPIPGLRDRAEVEADKFASYFLMPEKLVRQEFRLRFMTDHFRISEEASYALIGKSEDALRDQCRDLRALARKLATADHYNSRFFEPLVKRFGVSVEAMAIRLEEVSLLEY